MKIKFIPQNIEVDVDPSKSLMKIAVEKLYEIFGNVSITIGAQLYLKNFYQSFGFVQAGGIYDEDGIDHIKMRLN